MAIWETGALHCGQGSLEAGGGEIDTEAVTEDAKALSRRQHQSCDAAAQLGEVKLHRCRVVGRLVPTDDAWVKYLAIYRHCLAGLWE